MTSTNTCLHKIVENYFLTLANQGAALGPGFSESGDRKIIALFQLSLCKSYIVYARWVNQRKICFFFAINLSVRSSPIFVLFLFLYIQSGNACALFKGAVYEEKKIQTHIHILKKNIKIRQQFWLRIIIFISWFLSTLYVRTCDAVTNRYQ